jgi:hypothetical protein
MASLDPSIPRGDIARAFRNAWATEVAMALPRAINTGDDRFIAASLHWLGPQAYYAVYQAGLAAILAKGAPLPGSHQAFLKGMHSQFTQKAMMPTPWNAACEHGTVEKGNHDYGGCIAGNTPASNTLFPGDLDDAKRVLCLALKTTRDRRFDEVKDALLKRKEIKTKAGKAAKQLTMTRQNAEYDTMSPTTTFDFLYRLRIRSNYRDADTFLTQNVGDVEPFYEELTDLARCTLHAIESLALLALGPAWFGKQVSDFKSHRVPDFLVQHSVMARWPRFA